MTDLVVPFKVQPWEGDVPRVQVVLHPAEFPITPPFAALGIVQVTVGAANWGQRECMLVRFDTRDGAVHRFEIPDWVMAATSADFRTFLLEAMRLILVAPAAIADPEFAPNGRMRLEPRLRFLREVRMRGDEGLLARVRYAIEDGTFTPAERDAVLRNEIPDRYAVPARVEAPPPAAEPTLVPREHEAVLSSGARMQKRSGWRRLFAWARRRQA